MKIPYIKKERRRLYEPTLSHLKRLVRRAPKGDLTYILYALTLDRITSRSSGYAEITEAISALDDAANELRRRVLAIYEDEKIAENGDV